MRLKKGEFFKRKNSGAFFSVWCHAPCCWFFFCHGGSSYRDEPLRPPIRLIGRVGGGFSCPYLFVFKKYYAGVLFSGTPFFGGPSALPLPPGTPLTRMDGCRPDQYRRAFEDACTPSTNPTPIHSFCAIRRGLPATLTTAGFLLAGNCAGVLCAVFPYFPRFATFYSAVFFIKLNINSKVIFILNFHIFFQ